MDPITLTFTFTPVSLAITLIVATVVSSFLTEGGREFYDWLKYRRARKHSAHQRNPRA